jgi:transcription factor-like protein
MVRDLELSQGFLIALEVALWSGYSRKVEIAESFLQPLLTMLRRDNKFKRTRYTETPPDPSLQGHQLDEAWQQWVTMESWKRLAFKLVQHDTNSSMGLVVNPLVSYAEVQLPLPASSQLWSAPTAHHWKETYLARAGFQRLTLIDYLDDPEVISSPTVEVDPSLARQIFLSCAWSLAWEHIQMSSFQRARPRRWNSLVMTTRREELTKLLTHFRISMDSPSSAADTELLIRLELILLHLHTPFDDLQTFAGMDGPAQARAVVPAVIEWARGETARRAVWHAGQIVRATRMLPVGAIRGFTAIMVYHASVAFWVFALAAEKPDARRQWGGNGSGGSGTGQDVWLDEPDSLALQRFIQLGGGRPCIHGGGMAGEEAVHLSRPDQVMEAVLATLRANFDGGPRPLLVEKLIQLMAGLQRSSRTPGAAT